MEQLIERLEKATGPDRELDGAIHWTVNRAQAETVYWNATCGLPRKLPSDFIPSGLGAMAVMHASPAFTRSIDAARAIIPATMNWGISWSSLHGLETWVQDGPRMGTCHQGYAPEGDKGDSCAAVALCIAALQARSRSQRLIGD